MVQIITKEKTKSIVRRLSRGTVTSTIDVIENTELYYGGDDKFRWIDRRKKTIPYGIDSLNISSRIAYNIEEDNYEKKDLEELDELLYKVINESDKGKKIYEINTFRSEVLEKTRGELRCLHSVLSESNRDRDGYYLIVSYGYGHVKQIPKNEKYDIVSGLEMAEQFIKFIEQNNYNIKGLIDESNKNLMVIKLGEEGKEYWEEFVRAIGDFERLMNKVE